MKEEKILNVLRKKVPSIGRNTFAMGETSPLRSRNDHRIGDGGVRSNGKLGINRAGTVGLVEEYQEVESSIKERSLGIRIETKSTLDMEETKAGLPSTDGGTNAPNTSEIDAGHTAVERRMATSSVYRAPCGNRTRALLSSNIRIVSWNARSLRKT